MRNLIISAAVLKKLAEKHGVTRREVEQCFENLSGNLLMDTREDHKTDPPTLWFLARSNQDRLLKVAYIQKGAKVYLKSCFEPNDAEIAIYAKHG
ncbi:hypothetical protein EDF71_107236 [Comamonas sp. JUb58]|nr:hypothetical protein EDF71_107236 [Comamonas sp. JUb58]